MNIYIYNPSLRTGGTDNLMANTALILSKNKSFNIKFIDYANSPIKNYIISQSPNIEFINYKKGLVTPVEDGILIMTLLSMKNIEENLDIDENVKLLLWSTHPDDGLKFLSSFNIWYHLPNKIRNLIPNILHYRFKKRISIFFDIASNSFSMIWMDQDNYCNNKIFYNLKNIPLYLPITTKLPSYKVNYSSKDYINPLNIYILGRLCDFKTYPLLALIDHFNLINKKYVLNIIGDGIMKQHLENKLKKNNIKANFLGTVNIDKLDDLMRDADLLIGMGTSVLEGAKLGIPSVVIDASYSPVNKNQIKLSWLFETPSGYIGTFIKKKSIPSYGYYLQDIISMISNINDRQNISTKTFNHWEQHFSPNVIEVKLTEFINKASLDYKMAKYYFKKDRMSRIIDKIKSFTKSIYKL